MKILISKGANYNMLAFGEVPAVFLSTNNDSVDIVEYFHEIGYDFTQQFPPDGSTLLHAAAATGATRIVIF